jgi:hypothetical protein
MFTPFRTKEHVPGLEDHRRAAFAHDLFQHRAGGGQELPPSGIALLAERAGLGILLRADPADLFVEGVGEGAEGLRLHRLALLGEGFLLLDQFGLDAPVLGRQFLGGVLHPGRDALAEIRAREGLFAVDQQDRALDDFGRVLSGKRGRQSQPRAERRDPPDGPARGSRACHRVRTAC